MRTITRVVLLLLVVPMLRADCVRRNVYSGSFRAPMTDLSIDGSDLWVATSYGITLWDRNSVTPRAVAGLALPGPSTSVRAQHAIAYVGSGQTLYAIRKNGSDLAIAGSVDVGASVRELLLSNGYLFAATTNGVVQFDLLQPDHPLVVNHLGTTSGGALSLAVVDTTLYAADGDSSVEVYTIQIPSLPQKIGTFTALPQTTAVRVVGTGLFVSDGQQTQVYIGSGATPAKVGTIPFGGTSVFPINSSSVWMAGNDRVLRAVDFGDANAAVVLDQISISASRGSINRISAINGADGLLYVAAGDGGLATVDGRNFQSPFALHFHPVAASSAGASGQTYVVAQPANGLTTYHLSNDHLTRGQTFQPGNWIVHDMVTERVLASSGPTLTLFDVSALPKSLATVTMAANVRSAVMNSSGTWVVLDDKTLWRVDMTQATPAATRVDAGGAAPSFIARNVNGVATVDLGSDGNSTVRFWLDGDLTKTASSKLIQGAATSGAAVFGSTVAVSTFKGISVIDFAGSGAVTLIPDTPPAKGLFLSASKVYYITPSKLQVYELASKQLVRQLELPSNGVAVVRGVPTDPISFLTNDRIGSYRDESAASLPSTQIYAAGSHFYKSMSVEANMLLIFDGATADRFVLSAAQVPYFAGSIPLDGGTIDATLVNGKVADLTSDGHLLLLNLSGQIVGQAQINEGSDVTPISVRNIRGALHVSILKGCLSGTCEKKTLVYDPRTTLAVSASYSGGITDAVVSGNTAYLLLDLPSELRRVDVTDPFHPVMGTTAAQTDNPVAVAYSSAQNSVMVLASRLTTYNGTTLVKVADLLTSYSNDPSGRVGYLDQSIRVDADCATMIGRNFDAQQFNVLSPSTISALTGLNLPSAGKKLASNGKAIFVLTEQSLEVFSNETAPKRKRPTK